MKCQIKLKMQSFQEKITSEHLNLCFHNLEFNLG